MNHTRPGLMIIFFVLFLSGITPGLNPCAVPAAPPVQGGTYQIPLAGGKTKLIIHLPGFQQEKVGPDNPHKKIEAVNRRTGVIITGFFEPLDQKRPEHKPTPLAAREYHFVQGLARRTTLKFTNVHLWKSGSMAGVDYILEEFQDRRIIQMNYWGYWVQDNMCIRLHLSKINFQPGEERLFLTILDSVRFAAD